VTKEDLMARLFRRLMYELGAGRALDNARVERDESALISGRLDALERRYAPLRPATAERAA
jgi:hypothetical protein